MSKKLEPVTGGVMHIDTRDNRDNTYILIADDFGQAQIDVDENELYALAMLLLERYGEIDNSRMMKAKEINNG